MKKRRYDGRGWNLLGAYGALLAPIQTLTLWLVAIFMQWLPLFYALRAPIVVLMGKETWQVALIAFGKSVLLAVVVPFVEKRVRGSFFGRNQCLIHDAISEVGFAQVLTTTWLIAYAATLIGYVWLGVNLCRTLNWLIVSPARFLTQGLVYLGLYMATIIMGYIFCALSVRNAYWPASPAESAMQAFKPFDSRLL